VLRFAGFLPGELIFRALISTPVDGCSDYTPLWISCRHVFVRAATVRIDTCLRHAQLVD